MDTALSTPVGQLLGGRYHVDARIARGGMATVFLGTDTRLDRVVALKIAHPELSDDAEFVRRFIGEARSAARLSSPNVVAIFDQGSDKRLHYIAMEYVPGRTLRQLLNERGRLGVREALDIMSGVLAGLAVAHDAGFAHRDVKPENVLLTTSGTVKVADFGLARSVAGAVQTKGGMIIGTAAYLAPEQVTGGTSDARTDVYAAGIMLFELLTGVQPHTASSPLAVAYKHVHEVVPPPSSIVGGLSGAVDALVAMATSRDPDLRPASAGQFLSAISEVAGRQAGPPGQAGLATAPHQAAGGYGLPDYGSGPQPGLPYHGSGPQPGLPYHGSGPQPGPPPPGQMPAFDEVNAGFADPAREPEAGAVGASALPSLSPQPPAFAPVPQRDPSSLGNHTLVVSEAGELPPFGVPGPQHGRPHGGRYGSRLTGLRREPILRRYLFSHRLIYVAVGLALVLTLGIGAWWFSSGRYQNVPALHGLTLTAARNVLRNEGLQVRVGTPVHNPLHKGDVIRAQPGKGTRIASGSPVTLIVSLGPHILAVPNVSGQPEAAARAALRAAHLTVGKDRPAVSSTVAAGYVIGTIPRAYSKIPMSKPVRLIISQGPGLPSFVGMQVSDAQAEASAGGYTINPVQDAKGSQPADTITSQAPGPNTPIAPGEVVTVHYSPGPPLVPVPDVRGMSVTEAVLTLKHAGFQWAVNQRGPGNTVGNYSPGGNQPKGTIITIYTGLFSGM
jgi:eukaryotic-like serine/threonine-protein kinase